MFVKEDFRYAAEDDVYICPAGERRTHRFTNVENGLTLGRYWTNACQTCAIKDRCTEGKQRRITRWEHEHVVEAVERRLDEHPERMYIRLNTVEHPFGIKSNAVLPPSWPPTWLATLGRCSRRIRRARHLGAIQVGIEIGYGWHDVNTGIRRKPSPTSTSVSYSGAGQ